MRLIALIVLTFCVPVCAKAQLKTDWFNEPFVAGSAAGAGVDEAIKLIDDRALSQIVVAVIDDGVDIYHEDFEGMIWQNEGEVADNGRDDDGNGYIDDIHGWNFLGNPNGENISNETLEITRLYRVYSERFKDKNRDELSRKESDEYQKYLDFKEAYEKELSAVKGQYTEYAQLASLHRGAMAYYREHAGNGEITLDKLTQWSPGSLDGEQVKNFLLLAEKEGLEDYLSAKESYFEKYLNYNINLEFDPRPLVNEAEMPTGYGNNMVWAENPRHGTHVAGTIAARRSNGKGIDGIAPNALIMPLRAVPSGDERDKDVALAIRYAVDNGANIINMSFGKSHSPEVEMVYDAMDYAMDNNVLIVHAAGNDASDNDVVINYPDGTLGKKKSAKSLITVAAGDYEINSGFLAEFSNYGENSVDIAAPGVQTRSLVPENKTASQSGTSMAAPVVTGVAALVWGLDSGLSAKKLKKLLLNSANELEGLQVEMSSGLVPLADLLRYPAVISAKNAVETILE